MNIVLVPSTSSIEIVNYIYFRVSVDEYNIYYYIRSSSEASGFTKKVYIIACLFSVKLEVYCYGGVGLSGGGLLS